MSLVAGVERARTPVIMVNDEVLVDYEEQREFLEGILLRLGRYTFEQRTRMYESMIQYRVDLRKRYRRDSIGSDEKEQIRAVNTLAKEILRRLHPHERLIPIDAHPREQLSYLKKALWQIGAVSESTARVEFPTLSTDTLREQLDLCRKLEIELRSYIFKISTKSKRYSAADALARSIRRRVPLLLAEIAVRSRSSRSRSDSH